jgi:hypothetical protein
VRGADPGVDVDNSEGFGSLASAPLLSPLEFYNLFRGLPARSIREQAFNIQIDLGVNEEIDFLGK